MVKLVIIEDEPDIGATLAYNFTREGFKVWREANGRLGLDLVREKSPEVVLLDVMLPGLDGLELCRSIRADPLLRDTFIVMLTARGEESDLLLGLGLGADDYVRKPFKMRELIARVRAVLRRGRVRDADSTEVVRCGPLLVDSVRHEVTCEGQSLQLTATEFRLLHVLAAGTGRVYTRDQLLNKVIGDNAVVIDRNIDVHVRSIRRKLGPARDFIQTIRGIGYRLAVPGA